MPCPSRSARFRFRRHRRGPGRQPAAIDLNLRKDSHADIHQWFHFRLQGARGQACTIRFLNAGQATYPKGFEGYQAVASYDTENWFRVPTSFDGQVMTINHTPELDSIYYAYFEPYTWERHLRLLGEVAENPVARVHDIGTTIDGRDMNLVVIGNPQAEKKIWVIARQHPGETMAEWFIEGMMDALLDIPTRSRASCCSAPCSTSCRT
jgi:murein tripeptide amidase MpaA